MSIYRLRKTKIEAIQYDGTNATDIEEFIGQQCIRLIEADFSNPDIMLFFKGKETSLLIFVGYYIVKLPNGVITIFDEKSFNETYKPINDNLVT